MIRAKLLGKRRPSKGGIACLLTQTRYLALEHNFDEHFIVINVVVNKFDVVRQRPEKENESLNKSIKLGADSANKKVV